VYITGYRDANDSKYYIPLWVYSGHYDLYFQWNFLVDTGATITQLSWSDAFYYGIDIRRDLRKDTGTFAGVGGVVQGYLLSQSTLVFKTDTGRYDISVGNLSVSDSLTINGIQCPRISSMLGIDILERFDIQFHRDSDTVFLIEVE
jgi:hypothetical protein